MPLEAWLDAIFPAIDRLPAEFIRVAVLLIAAEMLKTGVTSVVDHFRQTPARLDAVGAAVAAYRESGMNAAIAIMLRDRVIPKGIDLPAARHQFSVQAQAELCREAIRRWHAPADGISIMLGPSAPHRCTDDLLEIVGELGEQCDVNIHTHVDENLSQRLEANAHYGCSTVRHLSDLGLLGPRLSLAHVTWVDEPDMDLLARTGTWVVHNPVSNVRLGSGIAPIHGPSSPQRRRGARDRRRRQQRQPKSARSHEACRLVAGVAGSAAERHPGRQGHRDHGDAIRGRPLGRPAWRAVGRIARRRHRHPVGGCAVSAAQ